MRTKKEILEACSYEKEDSEFWNEWIIKRCFLEVLIDIRDSLGKLHDIMDTKE